MPLLPHPGPLPMPREKAAFGIASSGMPELTMSRKTIAAFLTIALPLASTVAIPSLTLSISD